MPQPRRSGFGREARGDICEAGALSQQYARGMAAIGGAVAVTSALAPRTFLGVFVVAQEDNGAGRLAWRLFAVRTAAISLLAARGNATAQDLFLPVQMADQVTWWWGYQRGEVPLRTAALAGATSGAIIGLDFQRRRTAREA